MGELTCPECGGKCFLGVCQSCGWKQDDHAASRRLDVLRREAPHLLAQPDESRPSTLRIVVTHETDDGKPELLGTYTRSEEDAVFYVRPGGRENYAPADCCEIVTVTL